MKMSEVIQKRPRCLSNEADQYGFGQVVVFASGLGRTRSPFDEAFGDLMGPISIPSPADVAFGDLMGLMLRQKPEEQPPQDREIQRLKARIARLESKMTTRPVTTRGSRVYEKLRSSLEPEFLGKVVAIDTDREQVIGVGDTIEEAYSQASAKEAGKQFYFRRVGKRYLERVG